mgnify:CR=1 FL=1
MHLGAQHFRDDDSSRSARRLLFNRACCLLLILFLSSLVLLERARRACPPCFLKGARPRASHDRDTTPLHRPLARLTLVVRMARAHSCDAWETADKAGCCVQPCLTVGPLFAWRCRGLPGGRAARTRAHPGVYPGIGPPARWRYRWVRSQRRKRHAIFTRTTRTTRAKWQQPDRKRPNLADNLLRSANLKMGALDPS